MWLVFAFLGRRTFCKFKKYLYYVALPTLLQQSDCATEWQKVAEASNKWAHQIKHWQ